MLRLLTLFFLVLLFSGASSAQNLDLEIEQAFEEELEDTTSQETLAPQADLDEEGYSDEDFSDEEGSDLSEEPSEELSDADFSEEENIKDTAENAEGDRDEPEEDLTNNEAPEEELTNNEGLEEGFANNEAPEEELEFEDDENEEGFPDNAETADIKELESTPESDDTYTLSAESLTDDEGYIVHEKVVNPRLLDRTKLHKIKHPHAKKGLTRITSENEYIYDIKKSSQDHSTTILFSSFEPTNFKGNTTVGAGQTPSFSDLYESGLLFTGDYEWQLYKTSLGQFGVKLGSGVMIASGTGVFQGTGDPSVEEYTFVMFPNIATAIWRMRFWDSQALVPYIEAGGGYYAFMEIRDFDNKIKLGGSPVILAAAGCALNLSSFSREAVRTLDRDYGINSASLNVEYRVSEGAGQFDFSYSSIAAGFSFEY